MNDQTGEVDFEGSKLALVGHAKVTGHCHVDEGKARPPHKILEDMDAFCAGLGGRKVTEKLVGGVGTRGDEYGARHVYSFRNLPRRGVDTPLGTLRRVSLTQHWGMTKTPPSENSFYYEAELGGEDVSHVYSSGVSFHEYTGREAGNLRLSSIHFSLLGHGLTMNFKSDEKVKDVSVEVASGKFAVILPYNVTWETANAGCGQDEFLAFAKENLERMVAALKESEKLAPCFKYSRPRNTQYGKFCYSLGEEFSRRTVQNTSNSLASAGKSVDLRVFDSKVSPCR